MMLFHLSWDWNYLISPIRWLPAWYWGTVADMIGATFFWVAGMSQFLSPGHSSRAVREGAKLFGWGMFLTVGTLIYSPNGPILFGVLHSLGVSKILTYPLRKLRPSLIVLPAFAALGLGYWLRNQHFHGEWSYLAMWIGFRPTPIPTMADYYPILPEIGYMWLGACLARVLYRENYPNPPQLKLEKKPAKKAESVAFTSPPSRAVAWFGRHALVIYIVHQPILFGITSLIEKALRHR